jgi:hypothetical protein
VLIGQQQGDGGDAEPAEDHEVKEQANQTSRPSMARCMSARAQKAAGCRWPGAGCEAGGAVVLEVLAGVEDVEAADPEGDGGGEHDDARVERAADGDPGGGGGEAERQAEAQVRPAGEALQVAVAEQERSTTGDR